MKKIGAAMIICLAMLSCKDKNDSAAFTVTGEIKNIADQQVYLEQLYFSQKDPTVLDTAEIKNGKFELSANAAEEGLYRVRLQKLEHGFIFINDKPAIHFNADAKDVDLVNTSFNTPVNEQLKKFIVDLNARNKELSEASAGINRLKTMTGNDSLITTELARLNDMDNSFKNFVIKYIDTVSDPVLAMFALGYTRNIDPSLLQQVIPNLEKRFPKQQAVASLVSDYNQFMIQQQQAMSFNNNAIKAGSMAPDITMNDVNGKPFSLNSLRGKYVLVDFWASWCAPCRAENPNIVAAYAKFKDKNFTILGVSLDDNKAAWIKAIKNDNLSWQQVSDLKGWEASAVVPLYGFDAIPFNVLVDPQGKIIATKLQGGSLHHKLSEVLK